MSLTAGARLGPYEILAPLGAGGMGEVYRARDTRLDRVVAVKVLSSHVSADPQLRQRFEREARAISSLNHPNICALFDVGEAADPEPIPFLVMELVEGESLAERLTKGPLPLDEALQRGIEIADALEQRTSARHHPPRYQAWQRHADEGRRQAARLRARQVRARGIRASGRTAVTTATPPDLTAHGTILGTVQYMAPEQLEGLDARCSHRHLRVRRLALRDDHRPEGIRCQDAGEPDRRDSQRSAADGFLGDHGHSPRARSRDHEVSGQGSR